MPTDRTFHSDEQARRDEYDHGSPKDSNFNPAGNATLKSMMNIDRGMKAKGFRRTLSDMDMGSARDISNKFRNTDD